MKAYVIRQELI